MKLLRFSWLAATALLAGACGSSDDADPAEAIAPATAAATWTDVLPSADCGPGLRPRVGQTECVPVGVTACAEGFVRDPSGWGCREIATDEACDGASREALGVPTCVPIGDCDAPFPPAAATIFVDAAFAQGQLDARHFRTIKDAVYAAPPGTTIAVERGSYTGAFTARAPVTIVGRCARDVVLASEDPTLSGIDAIAQDVVVRGLTLRGHRGGVVSLRGGSATVEDCLIADSTVAGLVVASGSMTARRTRIIDSHPVGKTASAGVLVQKGKMTLVDSAVIHNVGVGVGVVDATGKLRVERSIVRDTQLDPNGTAGMGVGASDGGTVEIVESAIVQSRAWGIHIDEGSHGVVQRSVIRDVSPVDPKDRATGIIVLAGAHATLDETSIAAVQGVGAASNGKGAMLEMKASVVFGDFGKAPSRPQFGRRGLGVIASEGSTATLDEVAVVSVVAVGIAAQDPGSRLHAKRSLVRDHLADSERPSTGSGASAILGGTLELVDTAIVDTTNVGVVAGGTPAGGLSLESVVVLATKRNVLTNYGRGLEVSSGWTATVDKSIFARNAEAGIGVGGAGAHIALSKTVVRESGTQSSARGHGIAVLDGATATISDCLFRDNGGAGILFAEAGGHVDGTDIVRNTLGMFARGTSLREVDALPDDVSPGEALLRESRFIDNATRLGSGGLPLPQIRGL